jgi:Glyoxalase-like domain
VREWETDGMSIRWVTVFFDFPAGSFDQGVAFWRAVTGYGLSAARGADGEFATLLPPSGDAYLRVQRIGEGAGGCHLDLHIDTEAESLEAAAGRARGAGALIKSVGAGLVVAESPGGFPFCLTGWDGERVTPPPLAAEVAATAAGATTGVPDEASGASRIDTLCLDAPPADFEREVAFWAALTGGETVPARVPGFAYLTGPTGWPTRILLQRRDSAAPGDHVRAHADFGCTDTGARDRHVSLGAHVTAVHQYWTVLAGPASLEYCLVNRHPAGPTTAGRE